MRIVLGILYIIIVSSHYSYAQTPKNTYRDNYLALDIYQVIFRMKRGEMIRIHALYDEDNKRQKFAILNEFGTDVSMPVTREQVYRFVRKQFELQAVFDISKQDGRMLSPAQQNVFLKERRDILLKTSQALFEGITAPFQLDLDMAYRSYGILKK